MKVTKYLLYTNINDWNQANDKAESLIPNIKKYANPHQVISTGHADFEKYMFPIVQDVEIVVSGQVSLLQNHFPSGQDFNEDWINNP